MSSGTNTPNLGLHNWIGTDKVLRSEFNDNFTLIDTFAGQAAKFGNANTFTANQTAPAWIASGLTGAQGTGRWAGVTTQAGSPTSGTFQKGDWVMDPFTPAIWVCTSAGTPGTWSSTGKTYSAGSGLSLNGTSFSINLGAANTFTANQTAPAFVASGLPGATAASRYVGATSSGAPTSGTFAVGDHVVDQTGSVWICTVAGSPGTWTQVGAAAPQKPLWQHISYWI